MCQAASDTVVGILAFQHLQLGVEFLSGMPRGSLEEVD